MKSGPPSYCEHTLTIQVDAAIELTPGRWDLTLNPSVGAIMKFTKTILTAVMMTVISSTSFATLLSAEAQDYRKDAYERTKKEKAMKRQIDRVEWSKPFMVKIDCYHSSLSNTGTKDWITVNFYRGDKIVAQKTRKKGISCGATGKDIEFEVAAPRLFFDRFEIATSGTDAFYADEVRLLKASVVSNGDVGPINLGTSTRWEEIRHFGADNGKGWCLSREAKDGYGAWKDYVSKDGCRTVHSFTVYDWYDKEYDR